METIYTIQRETLSGIADAIRGKNGSTDAYRPNEMADAIDQMEIGGAAACHIAFGEEAPADTTKLWVKTGNSGAIKMTSKTMVADEVVEEAIGSLPSQGSYIAAAAVGTKVYLFGGYEDSVTDAIREFDTQSNLLNTLSVRLPVATYAMAAVALGSKIYLFGGETVDGFADTIYVFDSENQSITTLDTTLPITGRDIGAAAVGEKIYLFGGKNESSSNAIRVFDPMEKTITTLSIALPIGTSAAAIAAVGEKIYLFGGYTSGRTNSIRMLDTSSNTISALSIKLPAAAYKIAAAAMGTKVYLFGGITNNRLATINVFDSENNAIRTLSVALPEACGAIAAAAVGDEVYLFGGKTVTADTNMIHKFALTYPLAANDILLHISVTRNFFYVMPNVEVGVAGVYKGNEKGVAKRVNAALYQEGNWKEI